VLKELRQKLWDRDGSEEKLMEHGHTPRPAQIAGKTPCEESGLEEMISKAAQPIDWLFDDNYSCHYRAGINLGDASAEEPRIKSSAVFTSFPILMQKTQKTAPCQRVRLCLIQKKCGNAKQVTAGICTILREGTGREKYPRESGLKTSRIPGGAPFVAAQRCVFAHLQEQVPRQKYDARCRQRTEKAMGRAWCFIEVNRR
jgi:hypothetical protein